MRSDEFAFIFDLDGTLVDSFDQIYQTLKTTSNLLNIGEFEIQHLKELFGLPINSIVEECGVEKNQIEFFVREFRLNLKQQIANGVRLYPKVFETLDFLSKQNFPLAVATSKPTSLAVLTIANSPLSNLSLIIKGTDKQIPKPNPQIVIEAMESSGARYGMVIGDRIEDIVAGKAASLLTCGLSQTFHMYEDFIAANADYIYSSFELFNQGLSKILTDIKTVNIV